MTMERKQINPAVRANLQAEISQPKPRYRVPAVSQQTGPLRNGPDKAILTMDSFQNFAASLGLGTNNLTAASTYGFYPLSRNHTQLEWMYRGSWLAKKIVNAPAEDMIRSGISIDSSDPPELIEQMVQLFRETDTWNKLLETLMWGRLYGGACAYIDIDGQDPTTELRIDSIGRGQYKGLIVLDRWMLWPRLSEVVMDAGPEFGKPLFYDIVADGIGLPRMKIHHSRLIRFDGVALPYWQRMQENGWGLSVLEPIYDRLVAFDSATTGVAQLVYKAHLRVYKVAGIREIIAAGGEMYNGLVQQINFMRLMQSNEGITTIDKEDEFEFNAYNFAGLPDVLQAFASQLCGGADVPATRLFGQSPGGLNATGDSDLRNYYDMVDSQREARLRMPITKLLAIAYRSLFARSTPKGFGFTFNSLWQLSETEKATIAKTTVEAVDGATNIGISQQTALKELRQSARRTGLFSNITDKEIEAADDEPPPVGEVGTPAPGLSKPGMEAPGKKSEIAKQSGTEEA